MTNTLQNIVPGGKSEAFTSSDWNFKWLSLDNLSVVHDRGKLGSSEKTWETFKMSVGQEALKSNDPGEVKFARGKIKIQVSKALNKLEPVLVKEGDEGFNLNKIVESEVTRQFNKLKQVFELFENLHQRYCYLRAVGEDDAQEIDLQKADDEYFSDSEEKFEKLNILYNEFLSYVKQKAEAASLENTAASLRKKLEYEKEAYECSITVAQEKLETFEEAKERKGLDKSFPASALHGDVKEKYEAVLGTFKELESLEGARSTETKPLDFKHSEESKRVIVCFGAHKRVYSSCCHSNLYSF